MKEVKVFLGRFQPFTNGHFKCCMLKKLNGPDKEQLDILREKPDLDKISKLKNCYTSYIDTS